MNKLFVIALLGSSLAVPVFAQQGQQPQAPPTTAAFVRNMYNGNKNNIIRSAEKVPEDVYGLRPGPQEEVRTFGQHLAHVANYNFLWCSQAKGEKNPNAGINLEKTLKTKAEIQKALTDSFAYCDPVYAALTDENGAQVVRDSAGERPRHPEHADGAADAERRAQQRAVRQPGDDDAHQEHRAAVIGAASSTGRPAVVRRAGAAAPQCSRAADPLFKE